MNLAGIMHLSTIIPCLSTVLVAVSQLFELAIPVFLSRKMLVPPADIGTIISEI
jgi:hypothetical protein